MRQGRVFIIGALFLSLPAISYAKSSNPGSFKKGIEFFNKKQYDKALDEFNRAYKKGPVTPALLYNLGSTCFKLGKYDLAEQYFTQAGRTKRYQQLSQYNLGLIAIERKQDKIALQHFYLASAPQGDPKINALANRMIDRINEESTNRTRAGLIVAFGQDSNVLLSSTGSPTEFSDSFREIYAYVDAPVLPAISVTANYLWVDYADVDAGDYTQLGLGAKYRIQYTHWHLQPELQFTSSKLNRIDYQSTGDFRLTAKRKLKKDSRILLRLRHSDISSDNPIYDYLQGSRQQLRAEYLQLTSLGQLRLRYELETNDRQDTALASYSPTRHTLRARLKKNITADWSVSAELGWRDSRYESVAGFSRNDTRYRFRLIADQRIERQLHWGLKVNYLDNDSSLASEVYTRTESQLYLRAVY